MADSVAQKRILPPRERRESKRLRGSPVTTPAAAASKQPSTPAPASTATDSRGKRVNKKRPSLVVPPTPSNVSASPAAEELLPTKLTSSTVLPSTRTKQSFPLSKKEFQSIADSAILAASLHRSRVQWLSEGIFKKYWVKPVKRKGVVDVPPDNPDVKSMQKMGNGTITIEPHKFDVTFFVVRDAQAPVACYRPPNPPPSKQQSPYSAATPKSQHGYDPGTPANTTPATPASQQLPSPPPSSVKQESVPPSPAPRQPAAPAPRPPAPKTSADPVIQMLAARAASDPRLKDLMKVVATSKASPDQLREFQRHIDELNEVVRQQEAQREHQQKAKPPPSAAAPPAPPSAASPAVPPHTPYNATPTPVPAASSTTMPPPYYSPYPPHPRPEALIKHIVVEFHGDGSGPDRWLFPEYAVLDIRYGGLEMTVSYFVERKGSEIINEHGSGSDEDRELLASKWQPDTEYYQPVTMHVRANQHRTIETIARGAKTLPAVQEYMKKVMQQKTRAAMEYLVHQLPREKPVVDFVDSAVEMASDDEDDVLEDYYGN
ncbi:hypothetical protein DV736_g4241, partial [Chaetothyriales sp. CBS 134916]